MKLKIGILVGVLALVASSAFAGGPSWIAINGGAAFPGGDLSDGAGTGWLAGASYGMALNPKMALGVDVNYVGFGKKTVSSVDVQPTIWQYDVAGYYMFPMKDKTQYPYVKIGLGAYTVDPDVPNVSSKTLFGANGGLGWNKVLKNGKTSIGLDANYHWISQSDDFKKANGDKASLAYYTVSAHIGWGLGVEKKK
ncbi:MAG: outer membrane beta-barrel protein [Candidatus Eisenbacteria bacterium]